MTYSKPFVLTLNLYEEILEKNKTKILELKILRKWFKILRN